MATARGFFVVLVAAALAGFVNCMETSHENSKRSGSASCGLAQTTDLHINCDDVCEVFADGNALTADGLDQYWVASTLTIPQGTQVLAVQGSDTGTIAGIVASMDDGTVSDGSWKCSTEFQDGWTTQLFNDDSWDAATEMGDNGMSPWGTIAGIATSAKWIWTTNYGAGADTPVYCRKVLGKKCTGHGKPKDCADIQNSLKFCERKSGLFTIYVGERDKPVEVWCDLETNGGGWLVFQRREDGAKDFYKTWYEYADGFGDLYGEFWLGNHILYQLTSQQGYTLRVDLADFDENTVYAEYTTFSVAAPYEKYRLDVGGYSGDAGDGMALHSGSVFSTPDQDNDSWGSGSCAQTYKGAWWYPDCHTSNLNGYYYGGSQSTFADGVNWKQWKDYYYSLKFTEMKIRPNGF